MHEKTTVSTKAQKTHWNGERPSITPPIFMAASVTVAIVMTLLKMPM